MPLLRSPVSRENDYIPVIPGNRNIRGKFDRIYSLGMFEHVGYKNFSRYVQVVAERLRDNGLFLLQTIGVNNSDSAGNPWVERYIFPNSMLPSANQITTAAEGRLIIEDWHNFGPDYDTTLMHWFKNFDDHWDTLKENYDERFYRMWSVSRYLKTRRNLPGKTVVTFRLRFI